MFKGIGLLVAFCTYFSVLQGQNEVLVRHDTTIDSSDKKICVKVDRQPIFPKGMDGLVSFYQQNSKFKIGTQPDGAKSVIYNIIIDTNGAVQKYTLIKGINDTYNAETKRIVNLMPKWKPGEINGSPVNVLRTLEVFYLVE